MLGRRFGWFGKLRTDKGGIVSYGHRSVRHTDARGTYEFGFEDGILFPNPCQVEGAAHILSPAELASMLDQLRKAIEIDGHTVEVWGLDISG